MAHSSESKRTVSSRNKSIKPSKTAKSLQTTPVHKDKETKGLHLPETLQQEETEKKSSPPISSASPVSQGFQQESHRDYNRKMLPLLIMGGVILLVLSLLVGTKLANEHSPLPLLPASPDTPLPASPAPSAAPSPEISLGDSGFRSPCSVFSQDSREKKVAAHVNGEPIFEDYLDREHYRIPEPIKSAISKELLLQSRIK
ncbi:hypothetical protein COY95_00135, partial [Candidatus Woesearchaeota archaeon CG_4_10_14_0_8_um_filter_47_5]